MIAMVGLEKFKKEFSKLNYPANPRWALLDKNAVFLKGAGISL